MRLQARCQPGLQSSEGLIEKLEDSLTFKFTHMAVSRNPQVPHWLNASVPHHTGLWISVFMTEHLGFFRISDLREREVEVLFMN